MVNDVYEKLKTDFEHRRDEAVNLRRIREKEIFEKIPGFAELDSQIKLNGINTAKLLLSLKTMEEKRNASEKLKKQIEAAKVRKENLLEEYGYPTDYLEDVYFCRKCEDRGYYLENNSIKVCRCYINRLIEFSQSVSGIGKDSKYDFENFNFDIFEQAVNAEKYDIAVSPREQITKIYNKVYDYCMNFNNKSNCDNLYFTGGVGTGKTFMSKCAGHYLIKKGYSVLYVSAPEMFDAINDAKFKSDAESKGKYNLIKEVDCLIIDDLGTENITDAKISSFLTLINYRLDMNAISDKPYKMIISSNIPAEELNSFYEDSIASRIWGSFRMFKFAGEDLRLV